MRDKWKLGNPHRENRGDAERSHDQKRHREQHAQVVGEFAKITAALRYVEDRVERLLDRAHRRNNRDEQKRAARRTQRRRVYVLDVAHQLRRRFAEPQVLLDQRSQSFRAAESFNRGKCERENRYDRQRDREGQRRRSQQIVVVDEAFDRVIQDVPDAKRGGVPRCPGLEVQRLALEPAGSVSRHVSYRIAPPPI